MKLKQAWIDERATSAVEFALIAPIFFFILFLLIEGGLVVWTQLGLQHGAEMAARCASINTTLCGTTNDIQNYAAQQAFGINPSPSTFAVSTPTCGNEVAASYTYQFITTYFGSPSVTLSALSCFPK
jgi:Flp pilus assembly protein TadG